MLVVVSFPREKGCGPMWPFRKRKAQVFDPMPEVVRIDNTPYEALIDKVFEEADAIAAGLESGAEFSVTLDEADIPVGAHQVEIIFPVMMRAIEHDLHPEPTYNWTFTFTKL